MHRPIKRGRGAAVEVQFSFQCPAPPLGSRKVEIVEADGTLELPRAHLDAIAAEGKADVVVAGIYGHNRMREWVFGGVTRDLLLRERHCALVSLTSANQEIDMGKIRTANERHKRQVIAASRHQPKSTAVPNVAAKPAKSPSPLEAA